MLKYMQQLFISGFEIRCLIMMLFSIIAGWVIGVERERHGKEVGIRTYSFVIAGAALFTMLNNLTIPTMPQYIITGIGFLGGGVILKTSNNRIGNLTTAAALWYSAGIGAAIGMQLYGIALITLVVSGIIIRIPHKPSNKSDDVK